MLTAGRPRWPPWSPTPPAGPAQPAETPLAWKLLELLVAAESDPERRAELLRVSDELRELVDALGQPVDVEALLVDFGILVPEPE